MMTISRTSTGAEQRVLGKMAPGEKNKTTQTQ